MLKEVEKKLSDSIHEHLISAIASAKGYESPIIGYAIVTFHADKNFTAAMHTTESPYNIMDIPDMVAARLRVLAHNDIKKVMEFD